MHWRLLLAALFHCLFGTVSYSQNTIFNPLEEPIRNFLSVSLANRYPTPPSKEIQAWLWSLASASVSIGGALGAVFLGAICEKFGRRITCLLISNLLLISGCLLQFFAHKASSPELLLIGRVLCGASITLTTFLPVYLIECAPHGARGSVAMIVSIGFPLWSALGTVFGLPQTLGTKESWPLTFLVAAVPAFVHLLSLPYLPDSPKHLYIGKGDHKKARNSILFYHGPDADINQVEEEFFREMCLVSSQKGASIGWKTILRTPYLRLPLLIVLISNFSNRMGSIDIGTSYSTGLLQQLGVPQTHSALYTVILLQAPSVFLAIFGVFLSKKIGRRPHLLALLGTGLAGTLYLFLAELKFVNSAGSLCGLVGLILSISSWNLGAGCIPKFLAAEICPQMMRAKAVAGANFVINASSIPIILLYPPAKEMLGPYAILPLLVLGLVSFCWLVKWMPETQNKSVEDIVEKWMGDEESRPLITPKNDDFVLDSSRNSYSSIDSGISV